MLCEAQLLHFTFYVLCFTFHVLPFYVLPFYVLPFTFSLLRFPFYVLPFPFYLFTFLPFFDVRGSWLMAGKSLVSIAAL